MGIKSPKNLGEGNNRAALALTLLLSSCAPSAQQQPTTTPEPAVDTPDAIAEAERFLNGNREVQVNIPAGDNAEQALADFMKFCESQGVKCEVDKHDNDGDLMKVGDIFTFCRPEGGYSIAITGEGGQLKAKEVSKGSGVTNNQVALNELLRGIIQNPWMLEAVKRNSMQANGSVATATIPEDQIPENQARGEAIPGHPGFIIEKMRFRINCQTGANEPDFSGYPRKISDNGSSVFVQHGKDGSYKVSYGDQLGAVMVAQ